MEKFFLYSHHMNPNSSVGMDELCNFEANQMYASVDMHEEAAKTIGAPENAPDQEHQEPEELVKNKENEMENILATASDCDDTVMGEFDNADVEDTALCSIPLAECRTGMGDFEIMNIKTTKSPLKSTDSPFSLPSSGSLKRKRFHPSSESPASELSEGTSINTRSSGSTLMEDDTEDCDSGIGVTLVDGRQFEVSFPENIIMCINAGGASIPETSFRADFLEDCHFLGGDVLRTGETIANTKDPLIYQTARYGNFSYVIQDMPPGDYFVDLHFAEIIFTNGPSGLRVFDVLVQHQKVVAKLDVYSMVGSNTPLVMMNARATVKDKGLSITFHGIAGSPTLNGICIRRPLCQDSIPHAGNLNSNMAVAAKNCSTDYYEKHKYSLEKTELETTSTLQPHSQIDQLRRSKSKHKAKKCIQEYELKIQELKNEVHQAWMSVQDANRLNEKLQNELDCGSLHVDSLAQAVERQLCDLKDVKDKAESDKQEWLAIVLEISSKFQILKQDYITLAKEAHEWVSSFPAVQIMTERVRALVDELEELKQKFVKQGHDLRLYYNQVLELKGNIRVFCRCRPLSLTEVNAGASSVVEFDSARDNELILRSNGNKKVFKFDRVFTPSNTQSDVFMDTAPVVVSVLDGYNVCIFAYGQTGTGKTFTMEGIENDRGVNYRTLEELFHLASERKGQFTYVISVSVLEVYNEQIRDLLALPLAPGQCAKKLEIKQVVEGVHHVPGLTEATVHCMEEVWEVLQTGSSARAVGSTNSNEHSSRSHCMLCVMVKGENLLTGECTRSKLWLVDLAGSERVAKTDVQGERLKEAQNINKSLSALGDVIFALATKSSHIPYRNSKLTHILHDSLGGEAKTLMFVQISPSEADAGETLCSLNFASRVRGVELGPARKQLDSTETSKHKQAIEKLKQDARTKDEILRKQEDNFKKLEDTLKMKDQACRKQEDNVKKLEDTLKMKDQACRALSDKVRDIEGMLAKARSIADCKLKEQQLLIEKLQEDLKTKESCGQRRALEPVAEDLVVQWPSSENIAKGYNSETVHNRLMETCQTVEIEVDDANAVKAAKMVQSRYKVSSPATSKGSTQKPGRASLTGMQRKRASMAIDNVHLPIPAAQPYKADAMDGTRSSSDSLQDSFPDENLLPHLQQSDAPVLHHSSPKSAGWKKGAAIAPSTVLRRSIPRKIHFKSPHLQPSYFKASHVLPPTPDRDGQRVPVAERVLTVQNKKDQHAEGDRQGSSKMRRVSIASTWGRPPAPPSQHQVPWNATTGTTAAVLPPTTSIMGVAQRVAVNNPTGVKTASMHNRERAWNR